MQINLNVKPQSDKLSRVSKKLIDWEKDLIDFNNVMFLLRLSLRDMEQPEDLVIIRKWLKRSLRGNRVGTVTRLESYIHYNENRFHF